MKRAIALIGVDRQKPDRLFAAKDADRPAGNRPMPYTFTSSFPYLLNRVGVRMGDLFGERLAAYKMTVPMYRVLAVLRQEGEQRLSDLSGMVTVEVSTLSRLIGTMMKSGLLSRTRVEGDGRTVRIELTDKGRGLADELMPVAAHFETVGTGTFSADEVAWLKDALRRIYSNLDEIGSPSQEIGSRKPEP